MGCDLTSLEGAPQEIKYFNCSNNRLSSFEHFPKRVYHIDFSENNFSTFHNIHKYILEAERLSFNANGVSSSILGLLLISKLNSIFYNNSQNEDMVKAMSILRKYLPNNNGRQTVIDCQKELIEAGLQEFAKL